MKGIQCDLCGHFDVGMIKRGRYNGAYARVSFKADFKCLDPDKDISCNMKNLDLCYNCAETFVNWMESRGKIIS